MSRWRSWKLWAPAGVIGAALLMAAVWWTQSRATRVRSTPHLTRITYDEGFTTDPAVSPDGKFLAYASDRGGEVLDIWIQPISGGEPTRLTNHPADDREPAFSPDGSTIAFRSEREGRRHLRDFDPRRAGTAPRGKRTAAALLSGWQMAGLLGWFQHGRPHVSRVKQDFHRAIGRRHARGSWSRISSRLCTRCGRPMENECSSWEPTAPPIRGPPEH